MRLVKSSLTVFISGIGYPALARARQRPAGPRNTDQAIGAGSPSTPETEQPRQTATPEDTKRFNIRQLTDVLRCNLQQHFQRKAPSRLAEGTG